jgi:hypothetical protein
MVRGVIKPAKNRKCIMRLEFSALTFEGCFLNHKPRIVVPTTKANNPENIKTRVNI